MLLNWGSVIDEVGKMWKEAVVSSGLLRTEFVMFQIITRKVSYFPLHLV